jgi:hypothetical protein
VPFLSLSYLTHLQHFAIQSRRKLLILQVAIVAGNKS